MLHPSYTDLMKVVNKDVEEGESKIVNSRYSIEELNEGELKILPEDTDEE